VARLAGHHVDRPVAGDDAVAARWVTLTDLAELPLVDGLIEALSEWAVLPE
jgi:hypothetical protein